MSQRYCLELFEENDNLNLYTIRLKDEKLTEFEKFLDKFPNDCKYKEDIDIIISWIEKITEKGALSRYFKPEGKYGDGVGAIPIETNNIRLYCLRLSDKILILGNGGIKDADTWQDSPTLRPFVELLIDTSRFINTRRQKGNIQLNDKTIAGNLNFVR
ncbi:hypothetical protein [Phocaeicola plebeius]|jgi:hypothetical protein|uniref:hypothetical protein n=1 Tax=Phocaeicola plebeius TaxID=310297 RepID=UPI003AB90206